MKSNRLEELTQNYEALINRKNEICSNSNGIYKRYYYPVLTAEHAPLIWKYDFDEKQNPFMEERIGINAVMNTGAIKINHKSSHLHVRSGAYRTYWYQRCNEYGSHQDQS